MDNKDKHSEYNGRNNPPILKIEHDFDKISCPLYPEQISPWEMTSRSMESLVPSHSQLSINSKMERNNSSSATSFSSDISSESIVDAEAAGLLGGRKVAAAPFMSVDHQAEEVDSLENSSFYRKSILTDPGPMGSGNSLDAVEGKHTRTAASYGRTIDEDHDNFVLMYDMLTGIRHSVSVCQAKPSRPLSEEDFSYVRTYNFLQDSHEITPSKYHFRFKDYYPWVFRSLREAFKIDAADYLVSLTGKYALSEIGSPGKSGSFFYFSQDFRYIIKTIRPNEHEFLRHILRHYHEHIRRNPNSLLTRFYGLHRVRMSNIKKIYFIVMGNVFAPHKDIHETYDLKGSTQGRYIGAEELAKKHLATLKDLNWIQRNRKLKLGPTKATLLMNQLKADCMFLSKMKIMDYSLLIGVHFLWRGNQDRIRDRSMMMYEPATPKAGSTGPAFKQSSVSAATIGDSTGLPSERKTCVFYSEDGGFRSSHADGSPGDELYFLGVIDILTPYSVTKRFEHAFKSIQYDKISISAVNPVKYAKRFLKFMSDNILQDSHSDYGNRKLPEIPKLLAAEDFNNEQQMAVEDQETS